MTNKIRDLHVQATGPEGQTIEAQLERLTWHGAVLSVFDSNAVVRASQVFTQLTIEADNIELYTGKAVVGSVINAGASLICEVKLTEAGFRSVDAPGVADFLGGIPDFQEFFNQWQKYYRVLPEFKVVVADMQMFLMDLRRWLDQFEFGEGLAAREDHRRSARLLEISEQVVGAFNALHEQFEAIGQRIEPGLRPVHASFTKRQLHPLIMCSPFAHRTFHKPLGYAGDYEMVNMMLRDPFEGNSLYAQMLNAWFLKQWPAEAHRNRITYLVDRLREESLRGEREQRPIRVLNLGCGPAHEVMEFLGSSALSDYLDLTLWDFNDETVDRTGRALEACQRNHQRRSTIRIAKKSVHQVLKDGSRKLKGQPYDYIYCAGLFDYLSDRTCNQLVNTFYEWLAPGGLLAVTNVVDFKPFRHMLEHLLDWNLIYRTAARAEALRPERAAPDSCRVLSDQTGVNMMVETRKAAHV